MARFFWQKYSVCCLSSIDAVLKIVNQTEFKEKAA